MDKYELRRDVRLDIERLDVECMTQAELFEKWAEAAASAREEVEEAELAIKTVQADLEGRAREDPGSFGLSKVTDASVKSLVLTRPEYLEAQGKYLKRRRELRLLEVAVAAMEMKKRMIEKLIELHGLNYFAGPAAPRSPRVVLSQARDRVEERVRIRQLRVTRRRGES